MQVNYNYYKDRHASTAVYTTRNAQQQGISFPHLYSPSTAPSSSSNLLKTEQGNSIRRPGKPSLQSSTITTSGGIPFNCNNSGYFLSSLQQQQLTPPLTSSPVEPQRHCGGRHSFLQVSPRGAQSHLVPSFARERSSPILEHQDVISTPKIFDLSSYHHHPACNTSVSQPAQQVFFPQSSSDMNQLSTQEETTSTTTTTTTATTTTTDNNTNNNNNALTSSSSTSITGQPHQQHPLMTTDNIEDIVSEILASDPSQPLLTSHHLQQQQQQELHNEFSSSLHTRRIAPISFLPNLHSTISEPAATSTTSATFNNSNTPASLFAATPQLFQSNDNTTRFGFDFSSFLLPMHIDNTNSHHLVGSIVDNDLVTSYGRRKSDNTINSKSGSPDVSKTASLDDAIFNYDVRRIEQAEATSNTSSAYATDSSTPVSAESRISRVHSNNHVISTPSTTSSFTTTTTTGLDSTVNASHTKPVFHRSASTPVFPVVAPARRGPGRPRKINTDGLQCFNCKETQTVRWRASKLHVGERVCNPCGIYERHHSKPRPVKDKVHKHTNKKCHSSITKTRDLQNIVAESTKSGNMPKSSDNNRKK